MSGRIAGGLQSTFVDPNLKTHFAFLERQLTTAPDEGKYLCGPKLTGADILLSFPLMAAESKGLVPKETYPRLAEYVKKLQEEDGYKKSVEKIVALEGSYEIVD